MEFIEYMKFLLQSITFWVIFANIFIDFQLLQYFLFMLILWGNYHFIRSLVEEKYKGDKLILAWISNFILHLLIPILIIYLRKTFRHSLSLNNYLLGIVISGFMILLIDTEYVYNISKGQITVEGAIMWTIIYILSNLIIQKKLKLKNKYNTQNCIIF